MMTNKVHSNLYSMTMTAVIVGMGMVASQAMAAQDAAPPMQEPVAVATQAEATPPAAATPPAPGSFEALDVNADGSLAKEEIPADHPLSKKFKKADADKSGGLSKEEFEAYNAANTKM
jgi:hypothetical protein